METLLNAYKYMKIHLEAAPLKKPHLFLYAQIFLSEYIAPFQLRAVSSRPWCVCVLCRCETPSFPSHGHAGQGCPVKCWRWIFLVLHPEASEPWAGCGGEAEPWHAQYPLAPTI